MVGVAPMDRFGAEAPGYPGVDLPASALLDTLLLPLSLLTVIGVEFSGDWGIVGEAHKMWRLPRSAAQQSQTPYRKFI
jgi:hypothetical protein